MDELMNTEHIHSEKQTNSIENKAYSEVIALFRTLLTVADLPEDLVVDKALLEDPEFKKLYAYILDLRELSEALCKGDLKKFVFSKGYILSSLKALQSNLRHLTWQTQKIAEGDFSHRVDFLGDFSDSFNEMTRKLRDSSIQLHRLASVDVLTRVPNRLALEQFLTDSFCKARLENTPLCVLMIDIDFFKAVNDTYGHIVGDKVLVKISKILHQQFRMSDIFARYGGEEFVAGLPGTNLDAAIRIAQRARAAVEASPLELDDFPPLDVTVSIGVSEIKEEDIEYTDIIRRSDEALYQAKREGRNRVCMV